MLVSDIDWTTTLIASTLLLFGAVLAANMAARAAAEGPAGRIAALSVGAAALGAMIWASAITLERFAASPSDGVEMLFGVVAAAFLALYMLAHAVDGPTPRHRRAAAAALAAIAAVVLLALAALADAGALHGGPAATLRLGLVGGAAALGIRLASRRKRFSHFAVAALGVVACVALEPSVEARVADTASIVTNSLAPTASNGLTAAAIAVSVVTLIFGASMLAGGLAPRAVAFANVAGARAPARGLVAVDGAHRDERTLAAALGRALRKGELDIDVQPQRRLSDGALLGAEALARWRRGPGAGPTPDVFIGVAERNGLIDALGEYVLRRACAAATQWPETLHVAVNVSPIQLQSPSFESMLRRVLNETALSPRRLELELTETDFSNVDAFDTGVIDRLRAAGVSISIDDFGRGQSSLARLETLKVDAIKLDRALASKVATSEPARAIVRAVVDLARELGVQVLAEGVDSIEQLEFHKAVGCSFVQGFTIGRPIPLSDFPQNAPPWPLEG